MVEASNIIRLESLKNKKGKQCKQINIGAEEEKNILICVSKSKIENELMEIESDPENNFLQRNGINTDDFADSDECEFSIAEEEETPYIDLFFPFIIS